MAIDDNPQNIQILGNILKNNGYESAVFLNGHAALNFMDEELPDLILLDIMMPVIDGFQICKKIKENDNTKNIPIIFLTAKTDSFDIVKGFEFGAVDYITKPFIPEELVKRIEIQLENKFLNAALINKNKKLEKTLVLREHIERIIHHDLKGPLNSILGIPILLKDELELTPQQEEMLDFLTQAGERMNKLIDSSLDIYKMEIGKYKLTPVKVDIINIIDIILVEKNKKIKVNNLEIIFSINSKEKRTDSTFFINGKDLLFYNIFSNLIENAVDAAPKNSKISILLNSDKNYKIIINNSGIVPEEIRKNFFGKYVTAGKTHGTGLGTYSAALIVKTLGGSIKMETSEEIGTTITIEFSDLNFEN